MTTGVSNSLPAHDQPFAGSPAKPAEPPQAHNIQGTHCVECGLPAANAARIERCVGNFATLPA